MKHSHTTTERPAIRILKETIRSLGWRYALFVAAILLFATASLLPAQLLKFFAAALYGPSFSFESVARALLLFGLTIAVVLWISRLGSILCQEWLRVTVESKLRMRILDSLHASSLANLEASQRGELYSRATTDLVRVEFFLTEVIPSQIRLSAILVGSGALFFVHSGVLALFPLLAAVLLALANFHLQKRLAPSLKETRDLHGSILQSLVENFDGIRTLRSHGAEPFMRDRFAGKLALLTRRSLRVVRFVGALLGSNEFFSQALVVLSLTTVALFLSRGTLEITDALLYPFYLSLFFTAAQELARTALDWNRFLVEGGRLAAFLEIPKEQPPKERAALEPQAPLTGTGLLIGHWGKPPLAPPFDFTLNRRELCLLTGPSGCGKSTLLETLAGLRPTTDGRLLPYRGHVAYVEQRPYVFEGTLSENLTLGSSSGDRASLWAALESASIAEFARQAGGLDYRLADRGTNLSEGQRYRLALARAFLFRRPFLLLDEPFASLDALSTEAVIDAVHAERSSAGILIVSHQIPEGLDCNRILRFEQIAESSESPKRVFAPRGAAWNSLPA